METTSERVRRLIEESGITQSAFAERVGIEPTKLSKSLNGTRRFSSTELALIGEFARVTVDWLVTGEEMAVATAARASVGSSSETVLALAQEYSTMRADLATLGYRQGWQLPEPVSLRGSWISQGQELAESAAKRIVEAGLNVAGDLAGVIERVFGIDVAVCELGEGFDGLAVATAEARLIIVDATPIAARQRFTMAHELCHLLASDDQQIHTDPDIYSSASKRGESEVRANAFAAALLMPEAGMREWLQGRRLDEALFCELATEFRVSPSALAYRLENLRLIDVGTRERYRTITGKEAAAAAAKSTVFAQAGADSMTPKPPASLVADTFAAYENGQATLRPYAKLLGIDSRNLRRQFDHVEEAGS